MQMLKIWLRDLIMEAFSICLRSLYPIFPKEHNLILFGSFNGNRFGDNSAFVFKYLNKHYPTIRCVWLTNNEQVIKEVNRLGVEAYSRRSFKGIILSLKTKVIVISHDIKDVLMFVPMKNCPKVLYLHHGIPLRKGWMDLKNVPAKAKKSTLNKINYSTFMIAPSIFAAEQQNMMFPVGLHKFAITGLPRNDIFFDKNYNNEKIRKSFGLGGFSKIALYAPTWRPWGATQFFPFKDFKIEVLSSYLEQQNIVIMLRPHHIDLNHQNNEAFWGEIKKLNNFKIVTHWECPDVNQLCKISDVLITDYSSIYYDFLLCDKPVIFLDYDYQRYEKEIGFYPDYKKISIGDRPKTLPAFFKSLDRINGNIDLFYQKRMELKNKFYNKSDGLSSERVAQLLMKMIS